MGKPWLPTCLDLLAVNNTPIKGYPFWEKFTKILPSHFKVKVQFDYYILLKIHKFVIEISELEQNLLL